MPFEILPMGAAHVAQVAALEAACFTLPWSEQAFADEVQNPASVYFVALDGETVVGFGGMQTVLDEGYVTNIAVAEAHRRRGIAAALLRALEDHCRTHGIAMLTLEVRVSNEGAIALYAKMGFETLGRRTRFYQRPVEDAYIMTKLGLAPAKE